MASHRLSGQDKKDLEKFSKYLVYKCIQIIVQSRLGERVRTNSRPHSTGADWFNLAIKDIPEVTSETKKVLTSQSQILPIGQQLCVEISLKTTDGDILVLEKWLICKDEEADHSAKVSYTVYNRMGTLLKSLFCITRVTPSYRLSRKQGPDTFIICYRVYTGEPQFEHLGEGYNSIKVGTVATPMGTITISGAYRTKLLISPQTISKDLSNELKDDHFNTDCSPRRYSPKPCVGGYRDRRPSIDSIVSESDMCATTFSNSPSHTSSDVSTPEHPTSKPINIQQTPSDTRLHEKAQLCVPEKPVLTLSQGQKQGAFAPQTHTSTPPRDSTDDIPFMSLLHYSQAIETPEITTNNTNSNRPLDTTAKNTYHEKTKSESDPKSEHLDVDAISSSTESKGSSKSENKSSAADDFVMVELKAPFAGREMQSDLGRFYRDCQTAPQLEMFQEPPNIDVALNQISDQLAAFESNLDDIDSFVDSVISLEDA